MSLGFRLDDKLLTKTPSNFEIILNNAWLKAVGHRPSKMDFEKVVVDLQVEIPDTNLKTFLKVCYLYI